MKRQQQGLSLVEVLIAWVVLSMGLLGTGLALVQTSRAASASYLRTQAMIAAESLANRMQANRPAALTGAYEMDFGDVPPPGASCETRDCDPGGVAAADLREWYDQTRDLLPGLQARIHCPGASDCGASQHIELRWEEPAAGDGVSSCGEAGPAMVQCYELRIAL